MNKNIANIFVVIKDNALVAVDTNLKGLHEEFSKIVPELSYTQLYNAFRKDSSFSKTIKSGEIYYFQVVDNENQ